jgi:hypothetical protein
VHYQGHTIIKQTGIKGYNLANYYFLFSQAKTPLDNHYPGLRHESG